MATTKGPTSVELRTYAVGFGDCFLLSFNYAGGVGRHVLIDFGSTEMPDHVDSGKRMKAIADDIKKVAGKPNHKLTAVVATHRHKDHISGFGLKGAGATIEALKPDLVIQPWTEDPDANKDATRPTSVLKALQLQPAALLAMQSVAASALAEAKRSPRPRTRASAAAAEALHFIGDDNLKNLAAVQRLQRMGKKHAYVHFGSKSGLEELLPGVKVRVLGPPTLEQSKAIKNETQEHATEFWQLQAGASRVAEKGKNTLFARRYVHGAAALPDEVRWLVPRLESLRADELLALVRILDGAMNNTSVILSFEVGKKTLLFPGDAQIENWSYALDAAKKSPELKKLFGSVDVYKVGHHGSRNATPISLWKQFAKKGAKGKAGRLQSVMSTKPGKHGETEKTKVPSATLSKALKDQSDLIDTETFAAAKFVELLTV